MLNAVTVMQSLEMAIAVFPSQLSHNLFAFRLTFLLNIFIVRRLMSTGFGCRNKTAEFLLFCRCITNQG